MAKEITRDGITYKAAHTFKFDDNGEIIESYEGGEITEADVDSIIEHEQANKELEQQDKDFERDDAEEEAAQLINIKPKNKKKGRK